MHSRAWVNRVYGLYAVKSQILSQTEKQLPAGVTKSRSKATGRTRVDMA
jgi:hypothetical protein